MYNKRQELILDFIKDNPLCKRKDIEDFLSSMHFDVTKMTVTRDLKILINDGLVEKLGAAKASAYKLLKHFDLFEKIDVDAYFKQNQDARAPQNIYFNFDIFSALKNLLTDKEKTEFLKLNNAFLIKKAKLSPLLLKKEYERLTVELAWKSSQIEGNTYTLLDTERLLKEHVIAENKTLNETIMILNHKKALDFVLNAPEQYKKINVAKIEDIHRLLVDDLNVSPGIRHGTVGIVGSNYKPLSNAHQIKEALQKLVELINQTKNPLERALIAILMIAYIQPFEDGNKRTSRILGNALLLADNYCPLSYRSVDEVEYKKAVILFYEQNNASYFKELFLEQYKQAVQKYF